MNKQSYSLEYLEKEFQKENPLAKAYPELCTAIVNHAKQSEKHENPLYILSITHWMFEAAKNHPSELLITLVDSTKKSEYGSEVCHMLNEAKIIFKNLEDNRLIKECPELLSTLINSTKEGIMAHPFYALQGIPPLLTRIAANTFLNGKDLYSALKEGGSEVYVSKVLETVLKVLEAKELNVPTRRVSQQLLGLEYKLSREVGREQKPAEQLTH